MARKDVMTLRFVRKQTPELRTAAAAQAKAPGPICPHRSIVINFRHILCRMKPCRKNERR